MSTHPLVEIFVPASEPKKVVLQFEQNAFIDVAICDTPLEAQILCEALNYLLKTQKTPNTVTTQAKRVDEI